MFFIDVPSCSDNFGSDVASNVELETAEEKELSFEGVSNAVDGSDRYDKFS